MEIGMFEKEVDGVEILRIAEKIVPELSVKRITRVCEQYGENAAECREYDVYKLFTEADCRILKKVGKRELTNYERYLSRDSFPVPKFYGSAEDGRDLWIILGCVTGEDLRDMTDAAAKAAAKSLTRIQNSFWNAPDTERFEAYLERITRRYQFIKTEPEIGEAYRLFLERQKSCPRTMSNGDFLEFNAINDHGQVYLIDWGFGGIMPYTLDIARFIAHATEDRATFPFYMNDHQKQLFVQEVYESLTEKPPYERYLLDIKLAVLNEYVEFIEADEDDDKWYYSHARALARELLRSAPQEKDSECAHN